MLNKKRYRMTETGNEDKIDGRFGFTFKVKKCQVDKLHIFIYVNLSNWYFLVLNIASLKMTSKRRSNLSEILFTCFSIRKTCLTLCKNFFFKTFVIVWLFHFRPTYKIFRDFLQLYTTRTAKLVRRLSLCWNQYNWRQNFTNIEKNLPNLVNAFWFCRFSVII